MNKRRRIGNTLVISMSILLTLVILLSVAGAAAAQGANVSPHKNIYAAPPQAPGPTDTAELEVFLDDLFAKAMEEYHIAGAAIAVVKDGKLFFAKGYGFADIENKIPVDPEQTVFHVGSNSKLFTWTAVMQLAEQGKVDLDTDVNTYLDFHIPNTFPQPVTLKHLMTHTSGFAERWLESLASDESELMSVREWVVSNMPARLYPPGEVAGYSNYNAILAGYIVARVSGQPYEQYVQDHILDPLGMVHSTMRSPMPPDIRANLSMGYTYGGDGFQAFPDYLGQPAGLPSGGLQTTVTDMARFMIAHLENGQYSDKNITGARILKEATAQQMHSTVYTPDPRLLGAAYGFSDVTDNGQWALGHEGYTPPMRSQLLILPDQHLGLFVAVNTRDAGNLTVQHSGFQRAFFDHYYPAPAAEPLRPAAEFAKQAPRFAGFYRLAGYPASTPDKVVDLLGAYSVKISATGDGTLLVPIKGSEKRFVEVEPLYFRQVDGPFALVFRQDDRGRITHMFTDLMPQYGAIRIPWYELPSFNIPLVMVSVLLFISMLIVVPVEALVNRRRGVSPHHGSGTVRWILLSISLLNLIFLFGMLVGYHPPTELHGVDLSIKLLMTTTVLSALLTAAALVIMVLDWKNRYQGTTSRLYYSLVTVAAVAFVWFLNQWNLLGWRY